MNCEDCQERLIDHVHHELDDEQRRSVAAHLGSCGDCARDYCRLEADLAGIAPAHADVPRPEVRAALLAAQRGLREAPGLVADGRDMGTVVFPDADWKFFLTASVEERAKRRYKQLKLKGFDVSLASLFEAIQERDTRDARRSVSPLQPAEDAIVLDTSQMTIDEVVSRVLDQILT